MNTDLQWKILRSLAACAVTCCILTGCLSDSLNDRRIARYRPNVGDRGGLRYGQTGAAVPAGSVSKAAVRTLKRGDKVQVELRGIPNPELPIKGEVDEFGLNLPLIGRVRIDGKTTYEAEKMIQEKYIKDGYYTKIDVLVMKQDDEYYVWGEVSKQGQYPLSGDKTLLQAITSAGGYTDFAKKDKVKVTRGREKAKEILYFDCDKIEQGKEKDPLINPGDIIEVPRRFFL